MKREESAMVRKIELLSPAKDLTCGLEAIRHGADAVYIGAPKLRWKIYGRCAILLTYMMPVFM